jgi:hypothetical protein
LWALVLFAVASMTISPAAVGMAQTPIEDAPFRFDLAEAAGPRGLAVEGFVYNDLPWLITNVRLRVDSVDGDGTVIASASGWVIGDGKAGGPTTLRVQQTPAPLRAAWRVTGEGRLVGGSRP